jgi:predicted membrane-bound mannosyltransferase
MSVILTNDEAQQVVDALEWFERRYEFAELAFPKAAIDLLRNRVTETTKEQDPVAWYRDDYDVIEMSPVKQPGWDPLYTTPPKRKWVKLTDDDIADARAVWHTKDYKLSELCRYIESKVMEKNI